MNSRRSFGPITRFRSGSGPLTSTFSVASALMCAPLRPRSRCAGWLHHGPHRTVARDLASRTHGRVRLATFNILSGRRPEDGRRGPRRVRTCGRASSTPTCSRSRRSTATSHGPSTATSRRSRRRRWARSSTGSCRRSPVRRAGGSPRLREDPADAPAYGVALLSRVPVARWRALRLPAFRGPAPMWWPGARRPSLATDEPRVAVAAQLETDAGPLTVVNTHLSFLPWWNGQQLDVLTRGLAALPRRWCSWATSTWAHAAPAAPPA